MKRRLCRNTINNKKYLLNEIMFGFRNEFGLFSLDTVTILNIF